ncbi:MAG: S8 family serine peptidase, partial [Deltaproteobacteria bacterium]|nr:S8 family serine peptidase [Deltaproteobacteria bacterium]
AAGALLADVLIKTSDPGELAAILEQWGGAARTVAGPIVTAHVPLTLVAELAALDIVTYVEAAKPVTAKLSASRAVVNIDAVQAGTGLPQPYNGSGVIVGLVDSGIDCRHADFQDSNNATRLLAYWDQAGTGSGVTEIKNSDGREYTGIALSDGTCASSPETDSAGHGTHVAGIAVSKHATFLGAAPGANIVAVLNGAGDAESGGSFSTHVVDAVNYIFRKAQSQATKRPAVVNLSLGTSLGAHDDTSLFEQGLNALLKASGVDKKGRAIVTAAGNERFSSADSGAGTFAGIHATVNHTAATKAFDFKIRNSSAALTTFGGVTVDIWLTAASSCAVQVDAYSASSKTTPLIDMEAVEKGGSTAASANTDNKLQIALDFTDSNNANNGKQHAVAKITKVSGASVDGTNYSFDLVFSGTCKGDAWLYPDNTAFVDFRKVAALPGTTNDRGYSYVDGDSDRTMTIPGTASGVIAVGSFMGRGTWTDINGTSHDQTSTSEGTGGTVGNISLFSSLGPTADDRVKPDIAAPGEPIISTTASNVSPSTSLKGDATHHKMEGSSMAAPHVTGTVALMLQRNGCLTPTEIKAALKDNAGKDSLTGTALPNNIWGAGKLDALAAVKAVTALDCAPDNPSEDGATDSSGATTTTTTTSSGGGGCALVP